MTGGIRAYIDILRLQFSFAWPLLFCSGYLMATSFYGGFSWTGLLQVALIGFFGFEAGLVLNDYIDRDYDQRDVDPGRLTHYWRLFGTRPLAAGSITAASARNLFLALALVSGLLIMTLPFPHALPVLLIMIVSYALEAFYQVKKRNQRFPFAQLIGRTDFALFPVAGYLCAGHPDLTAFLYFLFFYPFALAHLGANDIIDLTNDRARGMNTITTLYGLGGTAYWIAGWTAVHGVAAVLFIAGRGWVARVGILAGLCILLVANAGILKKRTPDAGLSVLPLFHLAMVIYAGSLALDVMV